MNGLEMAKARMRAVGVPEEAIAVFKSFYEQLEHGETGMIREADVLPLTDIDRLKDLDYSRDEQRAAAERTVIIKLNGGLGTSMGMEKAKSLLEFRDGETFLDVIVEQVRHVRSQLDVDLPLMFMNSFRTREATLAHLERYPDLPVDEIPLDFIQNQEPKLRVEDLTPIDWPADPSLEWCPPGHADIYTAIVASGALDSLLVAGYRYASISNADNLGAGPDPEMMAWFVESGAPYAAEVCRRSPADVKGGHIVVRRSDGQLLLRETAQTAPEDVAEATDLTRHQYFHTNNLWIDLMALKLELDARDGILELPLIRNEKNVDPNDPTSPRVIQIESAMGAAIGVFTGATTIEVPRSRFLPVKTTNDLMLLRSDAYRVGPDHRVHAQTANAPLVSLDRDYFTSISDFDARVQGEVSLKDAKSFTVQGDWTFAGDITVRGAVTLQSDEPQTVADGTVFEG